MSAKRSHDLEDREAPAVDAPRRRRDVDEDEAMEFSLSDGVDVVPSFDAMGLKEDLLRGIYAYGEIFIVVIFFFPIYSCSFFRIRAAICYSAKSH